MILQFSIWKPVIYSSKENKWIIMRERERERERQTGEGGVSPLRQWTPSLPAMHPDSLIRGAQPKIKDFRSYF